MNSRRICNVCKTEKDISEFYVKVSTCKKCVIKRSRKYRLENPEKGRLASRKYRHKKVNELREYNKNYQRQNIDRISVQVQIRHYRKLLKDKFSIEMKKIELHQNLQQLIDYRIELQNLYKKMKNNE